MLGVTLSYKASNGAKKMEVTAVGDDLDTIFPGGLYKSLRYGATLDLVNVRCVGQSSSTDVFVYEHYSSIGML